MITVERLEELRSQCIDVSVTGILIDASELASLIEIALQRADQERYADEAGEPYEIRMVHRCADKQP